MKSLKRAAALAAVGLIAVVAGPSVASAQDAVAGAWKVDGHVDNKDFVVICHFERHGDALGGACFDAGTNLKHPLKSGSVAGDQVKWTYVSHFGLIPFDANFAGKVSGASMKGSAEAAGRKGTFTAAKQ